MGEREKGGELVAVPRLGRRLHFALCDQEQELRPEGGHLMEGFLLFGFYGQYKGKLATR